jgi:anti-sigma regulatory factor (Ser/Thr protein kinase)
MENERSPRGVDRGLAVLLKKVQIDLQKMHSAVESLVGIVRGNLDISAENEYRIRLVSKDLLTTRLAHSDADDILFSATLEDGNLTITIEDNGTGFAHGELTRQDVTQRDFLLRDSGRGVFLVRMMADEVRYNAKGNRVQVRLDISNR